MAAFHGGLLHRDGLMPMLAYFPRFPAEISMKRSVLVAMFAALYRYRDHFKMVEDGLVDFATEETEIGEEIADADLAVFSMAKK